MKTSTFRVLPLATEIAESARQALAKGASDHVLVTVAWPHSCPCRHCLRWADVGEHVILFPYAAIPPGRPYSETGPIFVHRGPCERYGATDEFPAEFRSGRVLRAYNSRSDMIDAQLVNGAAPEEVIEKFLQNLETQFVDVRSADRGCYTFRIARK